MAFSSAIHITNQGESVNADFLNAVSSKQSIYYSHTVNLRILHTKAVHYLIHSRSRNVRDLTPHNKQLKRTLKSAARDKASPSSKAVPATIRELGRFL